MRIGLAMVVLADLFIRAQDLTAFFTDDGLMPTHLLKNFGWQPGYWSFHSLNGSYAYTAFIFILHSLCAIGLLLGYRTKLATILVWIFTVSLHNRNLFILQSGDDLLRLTLFWAMFIPWGHAYSVDSSKFRTRQKIKSVAVFGYLLLISSVYFFTVFFKNSDEWRYDGSAIYYALSLDQIRLAGGDWLYTHPLLMKWLTHAVYVIEIAIPLLILWPGRHQALRGTAFLLFLFLHIGISLTMYVGLFYIINLTTALALIPGEWLNKMKLPSISNAGKILVQPNRLVRMFSNGFAWFVIFICLTLNLSYMNWFNYELNDEFKVVINTLRLNQYWGMFSPNIMKEDGWFVYEGYTKEGKHWDLKLNKPFITIKKPEHVVKDYKSDRWRKLAENMQRDSYTFLRPLYCKYYLKKWNSSHPENQMQSLDLIFFKEINLANYKTSEPERVQFCLCMNSYE